jgi:hypothetical protein
MLALSAGEIRAQVIRQIETDNTAYGTTAAEFLLIPATARGAALGGSFSALANDISAIYFNPAGLALITRPAFIATSMTYVADTRYAYAAVATPFGGGSRAFGLSVATFGFSSQRVYTVEDPQGESGNVYGVTQTAIGLTYSQQFSDRFSAGFTGKFINDRLGDVTGRAFALDMGTNFHANVNGRPIRAGFVIQNLGTSLSHTGTALNALVVREPPSDQQDVPQEPARASLQSKDWSLPVMFRVSLAYDMFATSASRLSLLGEFTQPNNSDPGFNVAGEYNAGLGSSGFSLAGRIGFTYAPDNNLDPIAAGSTSEGRGSYAGFDTGLGGESMDGFSAGGGLRYQSRNVGIGFDYAYRHMGFLGGVNMISVGLSW